jgi:hypothetical protein
LWHCEKRKKAHKSGILFNPWRLIQKWVNLFLA